MRTVEDLLTNYQHVIKELTLVTGTSGVFDVRVDGELIFSKKAVGHHAEEGEILELFTALVGPDVPRFSK